MINFSISGLGPWVDDAEPLAEASSCTSFTRSACCVRVPLNFSSAWPACTSK